LKNNRKNLNAQFEQMGKHEIELYNSFKIVRLTL